MNPKLKKSDIPSKKQYCIETTETSKSPQMFKNPFSFSDCKSNPAFTIGDKLPRLHASVGWLVET